ncbi:arf-GAP with Rho-GAP domain, ANK repeat and PH domain-containing protein 1 [Myripristis murdjan]|uniref:arf-GAP with Rho-GAP domain, ANK repeat and PH domain-containing protein 1 n=1 Tax=Myripristis murdjan TaxID=586833 RepID=UPI0011760F91|nr:arf-GAP with Rho-GAP domain, ANK repeat and PH domain-containing protein 1-like [Myripristis murdjan]
MASPPPLPPVPKPRARYIRDNLKASDRDLTGANLQSSSNGIHRSGDEDPPCLPPRLTRCVSSPGPAWVSGSTAGCASAPPAPPSISSMTNSIAAHIPSLAGVANAVANPAGAATAPNTVSANPSAPSLDSIVSSLATNIPCLAGVVSCVANPSASPGADGAVRNLDAAMFHHGNQNPAVTMPLAPPATAGKHRPPPLPMPGVTADGLTDVEALFGAVKVALDQTAVTTVTPPESDEALNSSPSAVEGEELYITVLAEWAKQEEAEAESSNEEEGAEVGPTSSDADRPMERDPAADHAFNTNNSTNQSGRVVPCRPAPLPPCKADQSGQPGKPQKQKTPRAATIRVSRKKGGAVSPSVQSAVVRASWLDVWKGFRHSVLWATLDGQLMSLWKKRTDKFSEVLFHVSSITNVKKQDRGRFSVYFRRKRYDFMAHSDEVQNGWVSSLLATRGQPSPAPPEFHGPITIKDPRSRAYAAVWGHDLWIYDNKEGYQVGVASFSIPLNVASVKATGKHSFTLITPYRSFSLSVDSSKELSVWLCSLSSTICNALSCSQVAQRLWENPFNKVCADCGSAHPEWASVNLLLVICQACAGQHRALGSSLSKVRSLKLDSKVWTEPLMQLFVSHGNQLANQVWAPVVPAAEQIRPEASDEERSKFIQNKYARGRYRRPHPLASCNTLMNKRLCEVVCGNDIEETMALLCSGAKVRQADPQGPSPIQLAERAGQALQTELLRHNEYTEVPPYLPQSANRRRGSTLSGEEAEELHGKLEEDRFLLSLENKSAACDVLDLREILSVFMKDGPGHEFEIVTLTDQLICAADTQEMLLSHFVHVLKVILPVGVSEEEVGRALGISKVCVVEVGGASDHSEVWLVLWEGGVSVYSTHPHTQQTWRTTLEAITNYGMNSSENVIDMVTGDRKVSLHFEEDHSCKSWFHCLQNALSRPSAAHQQAPSANQSRRSLYQLMAGARGSVPPAMERCISHVTQYGLKVEGIYRRCGLATKVSHLVDALMTSPGSAPMESDEQGILDVAAALKQLVRQQKTLIPLQDQVQWLQAAVVSDERSRFSAYRRLLRQLPDDNRATLCALFGHFYMVQVFSQVNRMSAHNLAVVLAPSLFQTLNQDLLRLTRELIIHHTLLFLTPEGEEEEEEEQITVF